MKKKRKGNEENYNFSPWKQFSRLVVIVVTLLAMMAIYALVATLL